MKLKTIEYLKETKQEYYLCRICHEIVSKDHFYTDEHIKKIKKTRFIRRLFNKLEHN